MKPSQASWWVKCLGYTLSVDVLLGVIMLLFARNILSDVQSSVFVFAVCLIAAPLYFFVKGNADKTLLYILATCVSHVAWIAAIIWGLDKMFNDWSTVMFLITGGASMLLFAIILLMDAVIWVWRRIFK